MALLPRDVRKALDVLRADVTRERSVGELAAICGVATRTLQKHFKRFLGRTPGEVLRDLRLERVRHELLCGAPDISVTERALRCGIKHLGRFAAAYAKRYGEKPSVTLRRRSRQIHAGPRLSPAILSSALERPLINVEPFALVGQAAQRVVAIADEISAALLRSRWLAVGARGKARYQLHGRVRDDGDRRLRVLVMLSDLASGRHLWADRWEGDADDVCTFEERVASGVAMAVERALHAAEVERIGRRDPAELGAWGLTMRALPLAIRIEAGPQARALELLERAMELAPCDALPIALAAWCHGHRAGHFFTPHPATERQKASELALRAAELDAGDPKVEALLGASRTLAHELAPAEAHFERALALDGGCVWAWNRAGWAKVYRGLPVEAIECFQIARSLGPTDPLNFLCTIGMGAAHFELGHDADAAQWFSRGLAEQPYAAWANRFLAPALVFAGRTEDARQSFGKLRAAYPELTIGQLRSGLPHTAHAYDRASDGLASLGMRP